MQSLKKFFHFKYLRLLIFFIIILYLIFKADYNLNQVYEKINSGLYGIFIIIILHIIHLNFVALRMYFVFKIGLKKFLYYFDWMKIYFESLGLNIVLSHTGTVYRAYELKKKGVQYKYFLSFFYILFLSYLILNIFFILVELIIFLDGDFKLKIYLLIILSFITLGSVVFLKLVHNLLSFFKKFYLKKKLNYLINIQKSIILKIKESIRNKKILLTLIGFGIINHLLELILFYLSFGIFLGENVMSKIILLFGISFILDRLPIIRDIPGFSEILFATVSTTFGFEFTYSLLTKFLLRFTGIISLGFNYVLSLIIRFFLYNKKNI